MNLQELLQLIASKSWGKRMVSRSVLIVIGFKVIVTWWVIGAF